MKNTVATLATTFLCAALHAAAPAPPDAAPAPQTVEKGFVPLFDGRTFEGWKVSENTATSWKIEGGMLRLTGGRSHLFTVKPFRDFVVRFEWRPLAKGYNSGFFVRGKQIQMAQGGAGMLFRDPNTRPVPQLHRPPGEWNLWEVTCVGTRLALSVNGVQAWQLDSFPPKSAPLGIEAEGHAIDFRNLRIRKLDTEASPQ